MVKKALFFLILFALSVLFMLTKPTLHIWSYDKIQMQIPSNLEVHDTFISDTTGKIVAEIEPSDFDMERLESEFDYSSEKECAERYLWTSRLYVDDAASETLHIKDSFNVYIYSGYFQISDTESQNVYILLIPHNKITYLYRNIIRLLFRFCFRPIYCQQYLIAGLKEGAFLFIELHLQLKYFIPF